MKVVLIGLFLSSFSYTIYADQDVGKMSELEKCSVIADGFAQMYQNHINGWTVEDQKRSLIMFLPKMVI